MTNLNQRVLEMVRDSEGHLSAEDAFLLAKKKKINVSVASIYRILGKLANDGYLRRFSVAGKPDVFDKTLEEHEHLVCRKCGKVTDIHIANFKNMLKKQTGLTIDDYDLSINYVCGKCKSKEKKK